MMTTMEQKLKMEHEVQDDCIILKPSNDIEKAFCRDTLGLPLYKERMDDKDGLRFEEREGIYTVKNHHVEGAAVFCLFLGVAIGVLGGWIIFT